MRKDKSTGPPLHLFSSPLGMPEMAIEGYICSLLLPRICTIDEAIDRPLVKEL